MDNQEQDQEHNQRENYIPIPIPILIAILAEISRLCGYHLDKTAIEQGITHAITLIQNFAGLKELLRNVLSEADGRGIEDVLLLLQNRKEDVVRMCKDSKEFAEFRDKITKDGGSGTAGCIAKLATRPAFALFIKKAAKSTTKNTYKAGIQIWGVKLGLFFAKKAVTKQTTKIVAAANPVGIIADVAQAGCEAKGYNKVGKTIGVTGNVAAGAMMGSVAGPPGAAIGAAGGLLLWGLGEAVGLVIDKLTSDETTIYLD